MGSLPGPASSLASVRAAPSAAALISGGAESSSSLADDDEDVGTRVAERLGGGDAATSAAERRLGSFRAASASAANASVASIATFPPVWVTKWVDYTSKYGLGYRLSDGTFGVVFNDATKMSQASPSSSAAAAFFFGRRKRRRHTAWRSPGVPRARAPRVGIEPGTSRRAVRRVFRLRAAAARAGEEDQADAPLPRVPGAGRAERGGAKRGGLVRDGRPRRSDGQRLSFDTTRRGRTRKRRGRFAARRRGDGGASGGGVAVAIVARFVARFVAPRASPRTCRTSRTGSARNTRFCFVCRTERSR